MRSSCLPLFIGVLQVSLSPAAFAFYQPSRASSYSTATTSIRRANNGKVFAYYNNNIVASSSSKRAAAAGSGRRLVVLYATAAESSLEETAADLKAKAEKMRLEAERMNVQLTLEKIAKLERKLGDEQWMEKHPKEAEKLQEQLQDLNNRLEGKPPSAATTASLSVGTAPEKADSSSSSSSETTRRPTEEETSDDETLSLVDPSSPLLRSFDSEETLERRRLERRPIRGFTDRDLEVYLPVAKQVEDRMGPNATLAGQLVEFRAAPELQEHFKLKIQEDLMKPMEDMAQLDQLKREYLKSRSSNAKEEIKRQMDQLEEEMADTMRPVVADASAVPPMKEEELQQRIEYLEELPPMLGDLYKRRVGASSDDSFEVAILVEHYEDQIALLDQIRFGGGALDENERRASEQCFMDLPAGVRERFAQNRGLSVNATAMEMIDYLESKRDMYKDGRSASLKNAFGELPEYFNDIAFVERSRYVEQFLPFFASMEANRPSEEEMEDLMSLLVDGKVFSPSSKPEAVLGGFYIRGTNRFDPNQQASAEANKKMMDGLKERIAGSPKLAGKLQIFYIFDPAIPTDEAIEMGDTRETVLAVTRVDSERFYPMSPPLNKLAVSVLGLLSLVFFALQQSAQIGGGGELVEAWQLPQTGGAALFASMIPIVLGGLAIQLAHEFGHRVVAWRDKFDIGLPNLIPSWQLGLSGAITPLKSPPPNLKSMFDFAIAGPLAGYMVSIGLLLYGLSLTTGMDVIEASSTLPSVSVELIRASALGGGIMESFMGEGVLDGPLDSTLRLHPLAVAGFAGIVANALALLPLGQTDGGRVALTMFGRKAAVLMSYGMTLLLLLVGLFGVDESHILLLYAVYAVLCQIQLETPAQDEVTELDFGRGLVGILSGLLVIGTLLPHL